MKKNMADEIELDFSRFMKKINEVESRKNNTILPKIDPTEETFARMHMKKYQRRAIDKIFVNGVNNAKKR